MIEIIKEPEDEQGIPKMPKEVHQIGTISGYGKIYMEDYVHRFLEETTEEVRTIILLGNVYETNEQAVFYIMAAFSIDQISYALELPVFSEDVWDEIYGNIRRYFPEYKILGWGVDIKGKRPNDVLQMDHICKRYFPGELCLVMMMDSLEKETSFYVLKNQKLCKSIGYFVYFQRNASMEEYLTDYHIRLQEQEDNELKKRSIVDIVATQNANNREERAVVSEKVARYRDLLQQQAVRERKTLKKSLLPVAALVLLVLSAVLVQNFTQINNMEKQLDTIRNEQAKEEVKETLAKEVEKKSGETSETSGFTEDSNEESGTTQAAAQTEESKATQAAAQTEEAVNNYLAQGYYVVQPGDRLLSISRKVYGNDRMVDAICEANGIEDENHIYTGMKLALPQQ